MRLTIEPDTQKILLRIHISS